MKKQRTSKSRKSRGQSRPLRNAEVEELKAWKDHRWKNVAKADLEDLSTHEDGAQLLADAIRAILRGR